MRKIVALILLLILVCLLSGCDLYADKNKNNMDLIDVKIYDINGNEVSGVYRNLFASLASLSTKQNLNSAAPVVNYYYLEINEGSTYTVEFIFTSKRNKKMRSLEIRNLEDQYNQDYIIVCDNVTNKDDNIIVRHTFENISSDNCHFMIYSWTNKQGAEFTFSTMGSNTYIKGVYFYIIDRAA